MYSPEGLASVDAPTMHIKPSGGWRSLDIEELWKYRELLYFLIWRDLKVRYKQTVLGGMWAIIQPVSTMLLFSLVFGKLANMPSDGMPYPLFAYAALVPWTFFANGLMQSSNSLVDSSGLITKVYFPRLLIPITSVLSGAVDFLLAFAVLLAMMLYYGIVPTAQIVWLPFLFALAFLAALGVGLWLAALNVRFRDVRHTLPFIAQFWMFATPIAYPSSLFSEPWRTVSGINPMVGVVEGFRWALLGADMPAVGAIIMSFATTITLVLSGSFYFRRVEKTFADLV